MASLFVSFDSPGERSANNQWELGGLTGILIFSFLGFGLAILAIIIWLSVTMCMSYYKRGGRVSDSTPNSEAADNNNNPEESLPTVNTVNEAQGGPKDPKDMEEIPVPKKMEEIQVPKKMEEIPLPKNIEEIPLPKNIEEIPLPKKMEEIPVTKNIDEIPVPKNIEEELPKYYDSDIYNIDIDPEKEEEVAKEHPETNDTKDIKEAEQVIDKVNQSRNDWDRDRFFD